LNSKEIDIESDTESIFVKISLLNNKSLITGSIYRPPNSDNEYMEKIKCAVDDIAKKHRSSVVWLGGDLNLSDISWNSDSVTIAGHQNPVSLNNKFLELVQDNHLEQVVTFPTRHENTLDLFLTNRPSLVNICEPLPGLGDHEIVYIDTDISAKLIKSFKRKIYIWKKANKDKFEDQASEMVKQFKEKFSLDRAINEMWDFFKSNILKILQESVPSKMSSSRFSQAWINRTVKQMTRWKKRSFEEPKRKVTLQDTVNSKVPPKKNVEKHIKIMSRTSSTHIYQATPKDAGASLKVNVVNQQAYHP
jgi:hypothetical protein